MAQQTPAQTARGFVSLIVLAGFGYWAYVTFYQSEATPPIVTVNTPGVLIDRDVPEIVSVSKNNEIRFGNTYKNKPFIAYGKFKEANSDMGRYHIAVSTALGDVACQTRYQPTIDHVGTLVVGQKVVISGLIENTWMGDVLLNQCKID